MPTASHSHNVIVYGFEAVFMTECRGHGKIAVIAQGNTFAATGTGNGGLHLSTMLPPPNPTQPASTSGEQVCVLWLQLVLACARKWMLLVQTPSKLTIHQSQIASR